MNNRLPCGCIPDASGYGYCYACRKILQTTIWRSLSTEQKNYDRMMAPKQSAELDEWSGNSNEQSCSCHINPPCSVCMAKSEENAEQEKNDPGIPA